MENKIVPLPSREPSGGDGGGPEDPMMEARVARLEDDVREIRGDIKEINRRLGNLEERFARMEVGFQAIHAKLDAMAYRLDGIPNAWIFALGLIGTVVATTTLVVTLTP